MEHEPAIWGFSQKGIEECMGIWNYNVVTIFLFLMLIFFFYKKEARKLIINHLMGCALVVFAAGTLLYLVGFWHEGTSQNYLASVLRSVTASMEMFVSESELIEVREECKEDLLYMLLFSLTHFFAVCISAAFIIHIMGIRFRSYLNMCFAHKNKKDMFVFFDLSQESVTLAKDIHDTMKGKNYQIVFVKTPMEESHLERFSFSHILSFADSRNETIEELISINALLTYSRKSVTIGMDDNEWKETVGLSTLRSYLKKSSGKKYFFCLSPNEENNINTAVALSKRYPENNKHHIYCCANRDSITESFASLNLKFIDSANLAIMELKKNVAYQPVAFVEPDTKTGVATKPFRSMIVGFGETGFEAFRFLYEFGSFVGKEKEENPFSCDIIDPKAKQLENSLYLHCPAVEEKRKDECVKDSNRYKASSRRITFHEGTIEGNRKLINELIKNVDYIVVCTGNEKNNLSIAITLLNLAYKYRNYSDKLAIFVSVNDNREYKKARDIAKFYNECGKKDKKENVYEFSLIPFGSKKQLFTYKNIIDDYVLNKAKTFYYEYQKTAGLLDSNYKSQCAEDKNKEWNNRREEKAVNGENGLYNKNELIQKEAQDMANVWHIQTKRYLVGACGCNIGYKEIKGHAEERRKELFDCINTVMQKLISRIDEAREKKEEFKNSYQFILEHIEKYEIEHDIPVGEFKTLFENLAKCEHLRWNASNRMLGYRTFENAEGNDKHYLQKTHACMVSNKELIANAELADTIKYDYNTILISMRM